MIIRFFLLGLFVFCFSLFWGRIQDTSWDPERLLDWCEEQKEWVMAELIPEPKDPDPAVAECAIEIKPYCPPKPCCLSKESDPFLFIGASYLGGKIFVSDLPIVATQRNGLTTSPYVGTEQSLSYGFSSFFDLTAAASLGSSGWELCADWLHLNTFTSESYNGSVLFPERGMATYSTTVTHASASSHLLFNELDLLLSHGWLGDFSLWRPYIGVASLWGNLDTQTIYRGGSLIGTGSDQIKEKSDFWAVGPKMGFAVESPLFAYFFFRGDLSAAVSFGNLDANFQEQFNGIGSTFENRLTSSGFNAVPTVNLFLGLGYLCEFTKSLKVESLIGAQGSYNWSVFEQFVQYIANPPRLSLNEVDEGFIALRISLGFYF